MSESATIKIPQQQYAVSEPTMMCSICGVKKDPDVTAVYGYAWICPECASRIKKLIYKEISDGS